MLAEKIDDINLPEGRAPIFYLPEEEMLVATLDLSFVNRKPPGLAHIFERRQPHTYSPLVIG